MSTLKTELHCGACMQRFNDVKKLVKHIEKCPEAAMLLPLINTVYAQSDGLGHPIAHAIYSIHNAAQKGLIRRYAYAVADETNTLERAKIHLELCKELGIDYNKFRPFESEMIKKLPTRKEALEILCREIMVEFLKKGIPVKRLKGK